MSFRKKIFGASLLTIVTLLALTTAGFALEEISGEEVVIEADQVIQDDLYGGATRYTVNGTIEGDLVLTGQTIVINGTVTGDLIAAGQSVTINGSVGDDVRIAGAALILGPAATIGDDLVAAGYSLETKTGSQIHGSLAFAGGQLLLAGDLDEALWAAANGISIQGIVGEGVQAEVGGSSDVFPVNPFATTPEMPPIPVVPGGISLGEGAQIGGDLEYSSIEPTGINPNQVSGEILFTRQANAQSGLVDRSPQRLLWNWLAENLRRFVALSIISVLLVRFAPIFLPRLSALLEKSPWHGLGLGTLGYFGFPVAFFVLAGLIILSMLFFGLLGLGNISGSIFFLALGVLFTLFVLFVFSLIYFSKIVVGALLGRLFLERIISGESRDPYIIVLVGNLLVVILVALPLVGWLTNFIVTLFGLGSLGLIIRDWTKNPDPTPLPTPK